MNLRLACLFILLTTLTLPALGQTSRPASDPDLFVAGTVVDGQDNAVAAARVLVTARNAAGGIDEITFGKEIVTDSFGKFYIRARLPADEYYIKAEKEDYLADDPTSFKAGAANVRLTVYQAGSLGGQVLLDPSVYPGAITVEARTDIPVLKTNADAKEDIVIAHPTKDGTFKVTPLKPGKYEVTIFIGDDREVLFSAAPVSVRTGELSIDARLKAVDLRGKLKTVRVDVRDERGAPISTAKCIVLPQGAHAISNEIFTAASGTMAVMMKGPMSTLIVAAPGYGPVKLKNVSGDQKIVMKKGVGVKLKLGNGVRPPTAPRLVNAALFTDEEMRDPEHEARRALGIQMSPDPANFDENGETTVWVAAGGHYAVIVTAGIKKDHVTSAVSIPFKNNEITVSGSNDPPFVVGITGDQLVEAYLRLE